MADTAALAADPRATSTHAGAKLLLTGDHRQLAAVGAAGGMQLAAETGRAYELTEARRFTHAWERAASLRLREGDDARARRLPQARPDHRRRHHRAGRAPPRRGPGWPTPSPANGRC